MAYESFETFLLALEERDELIRIKRPVATELEICEFADRQMKLKGGGKAILFEKPTVDGKPSSFPLAINCFGSESRMSLALGRTSVQEAADELEGLLKAKPPTSLREAVSLLGKAFELRHARPRTVSKAACQEVVFKLDPSDGKRSDFSTSDPTLLDLPILKCWPMDA